jgi:hypothetical protein
MAITPPNRSGSQSVLSYNSKGPTSEKDLDAKAKLKKLRLDAHLKPIQDKIESQPPLI